MTAPARLLSVRLQGFKSFAERTHVAFGPGVSAVVGPNGSGKSNLADALRWALGEQGRALRTRRSEDVIWAGSERRPALGMADVQLVLDNADGLLPVEFGVVELGRRLYRSGENEYVLNRQRVRLRDLVDLLDAAHLAENAFLFIGQGMVDQALALRPEERRPLFEEVAGVRRHERRRRRAEEQLAESEANLARVEDVVAELRPQVRRLAAQAEQQASRRDAGEELADALLAAAHVRWNAAVGRLRIAIVELDRGRAGLESALAELGAREEAAATLADRLTSSAEIVEAARRSLDEARDELTTARLEAARHAGELDAITHDRARLEEEQASLQGRLAADRRTAAVAVASVDPALEHELRLAEATLADAGRSLAEARAAGHAAEADREAVRRAEAARGADLDLARRRAAELSGEAAEEANRARRAADVLEAELSVLAGAAAARAAAIDEEASATRAVEAATTALDRATAARAAATTRHAELEARLADLRGRQAAVAAALHAMDSDGIAVRARAAGGRRIDDGLVVDDDLRPAVAAALGMVAAGFVVPGAAIGDLVDEHGAVVVRELLERTADGSTSEDGGGPGTVAAVTEADTVAAALVAAAGGGRLLSAIRRDPSGAVRALLARVAWLPDVEACIAIQPRLPSGWLLVSRDGRAVVEGAVVVLGRSDAALDRRAEADRLERAVAELDALERELARERDAADAAAASELATLESARRQRDAAVEARRSADLAEAAAGRRAEAAGREAAWLTAQADRIAAALDRARTTLAALEAEPAPHDLPTAAGAPAPGDPVAGSDHLVALERRVADLRATRDRLEAAWREADATRRDQERERARAEAGAAMAERRLQDVEAALGALAARAGATEREAAATAETLAQATERTAEAGRALEAAVGRDAAERRELGGIERGAALARETVQRLQDATRASERAELEARLGLDALREQLLVELAGLADVGLRRLLAIAPTEASESAAEPATTDESADVARLEAALDAVAARWADEAPPPDAPTPGRLATLRRRFHELGAANPYAMEEHAALAARLESLETQRADLVGAVDRTRAMIAELDGLIASQFRTTFAALETAFDARFRQLFGGGFARLSLTEPGDLASTGVEITARPPGKKPQALAMLSGGERALTAVALLFAMLEVRPVPFCVLDEVDAALDEANVGRFTDALRELAGRTQFVVITHNRGTIEMADALYGVTVGDDSVSRVISLRLEEATALAGSASTARAAADRSSTPRAPIIPAGLTPADLAAEAVPGEPSTEAVEAGGS